MQFGNFEFNFKKKADDVASPSTTSSIISESSLYTSSDFRKYNPDDLIGRQGYKVYKRMMNDEQIKAAVRFRRNSVTSRGWAFKFEDAEELSDEEKEKRINVLTKCLTSMKGNLRSSLNGIMSSMYHGFSLSEKTFKSFNYKGAPYWGVQSIRLKPFESFHFNTNPYGDLESITQLIGSEQNSINPDKMIHHVHNPEIDLYFGQSELREAYRAYYSKDVIIKLENIFLERSAGGFMWAQPKGDSSISSGSTAETKLKDVLKRIQTITSILLPKDVDLHVEMPKDTQAFDRAIMKHNKALSKALLMPSLLGLSEQGNVGSNAQSQTQLESFLWMLDSEAEDLAETINEQLVQDLGDFNFGDDVYPSFYFKPLSNAELEKTIENWSKLVEKNAVVLTDSD